ncbi:hypothetical protein TWF569_005582 [Orbilia oligospora]|uniref:Uncharacterized protein n=1 Tax=Orbilia oligospora TaxID=2813651 RepID=A0A7C8N0K6_ORBOL|nr:hypothetical protein TWF102_009617 [Orbilia oligospora]KAF3115797.1 hypothetical protein TWF706_005895 [Orbilia oligospora]KAF3115798.1 hypothetical protein TWF706_005895 [Orbilia oligospora]KAF3118057.1 hypothetical protein TWF103_000091 [Orbilia oligospora]KAF3141509.1 hypothetical protein TWF594_006061 [Orbilia oligospora]
MILRIQIVGTLKNFYLRSRIDVDGVIQVARQTPTPGPSLRSTSYDGPKVRLSQQRNCQDWVIDVLEALESEGFVQAGTRSQVKTQS